MSQIVICGRAAVLSGNSRDSSWPAALVIFFAYELRISYR